MTWRRAALAVLVLLLLWVVVDTWLHPNRSRRVAAALARHEIGLANADQERAMKVKITRWLSIAGVQTDFAIDEPPRRGRLNIFFTSPDAFSATDVGYGNAAYDSSIDAIFIDKFFVDASPYHAICSASAEASVLGCRDNMASQQAMFAFVFFHELGHRQLHGVGSAAIASRSGDAMARRREEEADRYSLEKLKAVYARGEPVVSDPDQSLAEALGFGSEGDPKVAASYRVWIDLFGALSVSTMLNGFLPAPYSPFYHDVAHPSLFDRTDGLLDVALADKALPENAKDQFRFFRAILAQEEHIPDVPFVEITVPEPIAKVTFTGAGIAAVTLPRGAIYATKAGDLVANPAGAAPKVVAASLRVAALGPKPNFDTEAIDLFWSDQSSRSIMTGSMGTWQVDGRSARASTFPLPTNHCFHWWSAGNPARVGLAATCPADQERLSSVAAGQVLGSVAVADLERSVRARMKNEHLSLDVLKSGDRQPGVTVWNNRTFLPILDGGSSPNRYAGILTLAMPSLKPVGLAAISLPGDLAQQQPARAVFVAQTADKKQALLVIGGGGGLKTLHWAVWRVGPNGQTQLVTERPFLLATALQSLSLTTISDFDPYLVEVLAIGPGFALVNLSGEGIFLVDLVHGKAQLLYGYGGTAFRSATSADGKVALYVPGAGKVFVFDPAGR